MEANSHKDFSYPSLKLGTYKMEYAHDKWYLGVAHCSTSGTLLMFLELSHLELVREVPTSNLYFDCNLCPWDDGKFGGEFDGVYAHMSLLWKKMERQESEFYGHMGVQVTSWIGNFWATIWLRCLSK
jgi:hypothetical protein